MNAPAQHIVATYPYCEADGTLSYEVVRYQPKTFKQRRPDGRGGWVYSIKGIKPLPYRLPRVLATIRADGLIWKVEGEKDTDNLNTALDQAIENAAATCNNGGAGHWGGEQSEYFTGARVAIIPDNDAPDPKTGKRTGFEDAFKTAKHLHQAGASIIKIVYLPEIFNGSPVKDVTDFLQAGGTIAELYSLYEAAPVYVPPVEIEKPARRPAPIRIDDHSRLRKWAVAAKDNIVSEMASLTEGRFGALTAGCNRLGTIAAHGLLTESECMADVMYALDANGYSQKVGQAVAERRAVFYFRSGLSHPCELPEAAPPTMQVVSRQVPDPQPLPDFDLVRDGIPHNALSALLKYISPSAAITCRLLIVSIQEGIADKDDFTIGDLDTVNVSHSFDIPESTIRRGMKELDKIGFLSVFPIYKADHNKQESNSDPSSGKSERKSSPCHRQAIRYRVVLTLEQLIARILRRAYYRIIEGRHRLTDDNSPEPIITPAFLQALECAESEAEEIAGEISKVQKPTSQQKQAANEAARRFSRLQRNLQDYTVRPFPNGARWRNGAEFAECLARAWAESNPDVQISDSEVSEFIGVSERTAKNKLAAAGVRSLRVEPERAINSAEELHRFTPGMGKPIKLISRDETGRTLAYGALINAEQFIKSQPSGAAVAVVHRQPSRRICLPDWEQAERKPRTARPDQPEKTEEIALDPEPEPRENKPRIRRYLGTGHNPDWARAWALRMTGQSGTVGNQKLIELLRGHNLKVSEPDKTLHFANSENPTLSSADAIERLAQRIRLSIGQGQGFDQFFPEMQALESSLPFREQVRMVGVFDRIDRAIFDRFTDWQTEGQAA